MKQSSVVGAPEIDGDAVVLRLVVEDPALEDSGGVFECRLKGFGEISVERSPRGQSAWSDGALRAAAAVAALEYAVKNSDLFQPLFERLECR